jgi:hypothetical protein
VFDEITLNLVTFAVQAALWQSTQLVPSLGIAAAVYGRHTKALPIDAVCQHAGAFW